MTFENNAILENCFSDMALKVFSLLINSFLIDVLIIYCFTSRSSIFHLYGDVTMSMKCAILDVSVLVLF